MSHNTQGTPESARRVSYTNSPGNPIFGFGSTRTASGSVKDTINRFEPNQVKQEDVYGNGARSDTTKQGSELESVEHMTDLPQVDTMPTDTTAAPNRTAQDDISQMQKDNVEKFNLALKSLLSEYMPAPLLQPHPNIPTTTSLSSSPSATVPSILEMEVRHAISQAARNVYHAHIRDDKKRKAFDFKYAELQDLYFGKGRKVAREMRRLARDGNNCKGTDAADVGVGELSVSASKLGIRGDGRVRGIFGDREDMMSGSG